MASLDPTAMLEKPQPRKASREILFRLIGTCDPWFRVLGLAWITPIWRAIAGDNPRGQLKDIWRLALVPTLSIAAFLTLWAVLAPQVQTSLGAIPGPAQVWEQALVLNQSAVAERAKAAKFYVKQDEKNAALVAEGKADAVKDHSYTGKPTFYQQIWTSIKTVFQIC